MQLRGIYYGTQHNRASPLSALRGLHVLHTWWHWVLWVGHNALFDTCKFNNVLKVKTCKLFQVNNCYYVCLGTEDRVEWSCVWTVWRFPTLAAAFESGLMYATQVYRVTESLAPTTTLWRSYVAQKFKTLAKHTLYSCAFLKND